MGLDMYLKVRKEHYYSGYSSGVNLTRSKYPKSLSECIPQCPTDIVVSTTEDYRVGYWRKANAIHKWFVDNVQHGDDDCNEYAVSINQLEDLLGICKKVSKNHALAPVYLPTQEGFFFGSLDYDEYYFENIDKTIEIIESLIPAIQKLNKIHELNVARAKKNGAEYVWSEPYKIYYCSSW